MQTSPIDLGYSFNTLYILDCLGEDELQTGKKLNEDLNDIPFRIRRTTIKYGKARTRAKFVDYFGAIMKDCLEGKLPILHIECHGSKKNGLEMPDGTLLLSWQELAALTRPLNEVTRNNLGIVLAACDGVYLAEQMTWVEPSPFAYLVGSDKSVGAGETSKSTRAFYSTLFDTMDLPRAHSQMSEKFILYQAWQHFFHYLGAQYKEALIGSGKKKMVEQQLSNLTKYTFALNHLGLGKLREIAKEVVQPTASKYEEQCRVFFHGLVPVPFEDFMSSVEGKPTKALGGNN